jgi:NAD(P)-dependent dehydrogenase (short-subunit alcohol dehydrogenase family)
MRLSNKVIIITGSTTGIGKAIALRCVAEGARVVILGLEDEWGKQVVEGRNLKEKAMFTLIERSKPY